MLGAVEELWDEVAIAMYPSRKAMLQMIQMPEYAEISVHRSAGLAGQLNIETINASGQWLWNRLSKTRHPRLVSRSTQNRSTFVDGRLTMRPPRITRR